MAEIKIFKRMGKYAILCILRVDISYISLDHLLEGALPEV